MSLSIYVCIYIYMYVYIYPQEGTPKVGKLVSKTSLTRLTSYSLDICYFHGYICDRILWGYVRRFTTKRIWEVGFLDFGTMC